jgi:hypothetical protein
MALYSSGSLGRPVANGLKLDLVAQAVQTANQMGRGSLSLSPITILRAQIAVIHLVLQHVIDGHQDRMP